MGDRDLDWACEGMVGWAVGHGLGYAVCVSAIRPVVVGPGGAGVAQQGIGGQHLAVGVRRRLCADRAGRVSG